MFGSFSESRFKRRENFKIVFKFVMVCVWSVVFIFTLFEIKDYYDIDVIPGVNTSIDDIYASAKGGMSNIFR